MLAETENLEIILDTFTVPQYYGDIVEIALPTFHVEGITKCKMLLDKEPYVPVPYTVAIYKWVSGKDGYYTYKFMGIEIRNIN